MLVFFLIVDAVPGGPGLGRMFNVGFYLLFCFCFFLGGGKKKFFFGYTIIAMRTFYIGAYN